MDKDKLNEYYNVYDIRHLNVRSFNENVDVKNIQAAYNHNKRMSDKIKNAMEQSDLKLRIQD